MTFNRSLTEISRAFQTSSIVKFEGKLAVGALASIKEFLRLGGLCA
jgi:hypothetical protein